MLTRLNAATNLITLATQIILNNEFLSIKQEKLIHTQQKGFLWCLFGWIRFIRAMEAFDAERKIKGWSRKKKDALTRKDWERISIKLCSRG